MAMNNIFGLFAQSPLKPLQKHARKVVACSELLEPFFEATFDHDWDKAAEIRAQIVELERRSDLLKREIRLKLPRGLFLPVARTDLLEIVTQLDKLANYSRDISGRILGRHLLVPEIMQPAFRQFLFRSLDPMAATTAARIWPWLLAGIGTLSLAGVVWAVLVARRRSVTSAAGHEAAAPPTREQAVRERDLPEEEPW